jgi:CRP-like cAMP-binding protein
MGVRSHTPRSLMAILLQVRKLIVSRIEAGVPHKVITEATEVSPNTFSRLLRRRRETGQLAPGHG